MSYSSGPYSSPAIPSYAVEQSAKSPSKYNVEPKKRGWFSRWFDRKFRESLERSKNDPERPEVYQVSLASLQESRHIHTPTSLDIKIHSATGGTIIEFRRYDNIKDRNDNKLYVVSSNDDFTQEFAKIVTLEMMR